jgi:two-component system sensor histidine kinase YesM
MSGWKIPKMSIQPLVENACKHGLQSISGARRLTLGAAMDEDGAVVITLTDNGSGMDAETVSSLLESLESDQPAPPSPQYSPLGQAGFGIGLQNVYRRMKMNYGDKFTFGIESKLGKGTAITIRIEAGEAALP